MERARNAELTRQVIALSDTKALRAITPAQPRAQRLSIDEGRLKSPTDTYRSAANVISEAREALRKPVRES